MALEVTNEIQSTASNQTVAQAKYIADDDFMTAHSTTDNKQNTINEWLAEKIEEIPTPMQFQGTLGTGGTITALPTAGSGNKGYVYKVITAGTYQSQAAEEGDVFISNGTDWVLIPSGDEPSGTVTSVGAQGSNGITVTGSPITTSGTLTISHSNSVTAQTTQALYPIKIDAQGHVSGYGSAVTVPTKTSQLTNDSDFATNSDLDDKQDTITDLSTIRSNAANGATAYGWGNHANAGYSTTDTKVTTVTTTGSGNAVTTGSVSSDGKTVTLTKGATFLTEHQDLTDYIQKSNTSGLLKNDGSVDTTAYTANTGTVTSVQVQATSPVQSSVNTAQTSALNTTISLANGYGDIKNPYTAKPLHYVLAAKSTGASTDTERDVEFRQLDYTDLTGTPSALSTTAHNASESYFVTGSGYTTTPTKFLREDGTWQTPSGSGTVTSVTAGTGLSGGTITTSGTISLNTATVSAIGGVKTGYTTTNHSTKVEMEIDSGSSVPTGNIYVPIGATVKSVGVIQGDPWENDDTGIAVYRAESNTVGGVFEGQLFIHTGDLVTWLQNDSSTNRNMFLQLIYQYVQEQGGVTP